MVHYAPLIRSFMYDPSDQHYDHFKAYFALIPSYVPDPTSDFRVFGTLRLPLATLPSHWPTAHCPLPNCLLPPTPRGAKCLSPALVPMPALMPMRCLSQPRPLDIMRYDGVVQAVVVMLNQRHLGHLGDLPSPHDPCPASPAVECGTASSSAAACGPTSASSLPPCPPAATHCKSGNVGT